MAPTCPDRLSGACRELPQSSRLVVKHTFLEVVESPVHETAFSGGATFLYKRASSDSALCDTCAQEEARKDWQNQHQQPAAAAASSAAVGKDEGEEPAFELTGLSDTETDDGAPTGSTSEPALLCYQHIDDEAPFLRGCTGTTSATASASWSRAPSDSSSTPPPQTADAEGSSINELLSENARLALENQLLRENMRLAQEIQEMKQQAAAQVSMVEDLYGPMTDFSGQQWCIPMASAAMQPQQMRPSTGVSAAGKRGGQQQQQQQQQRGAKSASKNGSAASGAEVPAEPQTTVMLRNLPNNYTRAMVLAMLDDEGFQGLYDFLYLPIDFNSRACLGYAFVNLTDPTFVPAFWEAFDGYAKWILPSRKVCRVSWSGPHQGLDSHVNRYRNSPVMHESVPDEFKPVLFKDGIRVVFPTSSKAPRAPRVRHREATMRGDGRR